MRSISRDAARFAMLAMTAVLGCLPLVAQGEMGSVDTASLHATSLEATSLETTLRRLDELEAQVKDLSRYSLSAAEHRHVGCEINTAPNCLVRPGWEASVELLYLKLHQRGLDFAVSEDGTALTLGAGDVHNLDFDRDPGMRVTIGYRTAPDWTVRFAYTTFDTDGQAFAVRPDGIGQLFATRSQPDGAEEADTARARGAFDYQVFDLFAEKPVHSNRFAVVSLFGGLRWIDVDHRLEYDYDGRDFDNARIIDHMRMDGFGLRMGGEARWRMAAGLSAFGSMATTLTYGRFETRFFEDNLDQTVVVTNLRDRFDQAVANVEARAGIAYTWCNWTVSAGYEMIDWFNLAERAIFVDDIQEATYVPLAQDILLEGLFVQLAFVR